MENKNNSLDRINLLDFWPSSYLLDVWEKGMGNFMRAKGFLVTEGEDEIVLMSQYNDYLFDYLEDLAAKAKVSFSESGKIIPNTIREYFVISSKAFYERFIFLHSLAYISSSYLVELSEYSPSSGGLAQEMKETIQDFKDNKTLFGEHLKYCGRLFEHAMSAQEYVVNSAFKIIVSRETRTDSSNGQ
jgi:hypothetical protein